MTNNDALRGYFGIDDITDIWHTIQAWLDSLFRKFHLPRRTIYELKDLFSVFLGWEVLAMSNHVDGYTYHRPSTRLTFQ